MALLIPRACVWTHYTFSSYLGIQMMPFIATWSISILVKPMMQIRCSANLWCLKIKLLFIAPGHREIKIECVATQLEIAEWDARVNYSVMDEAKLGFIHPLIIYFVVFIYLCVCMYCEHVCVPRSFCTMPVLNVHDDSQLIFWEDMSWKFLGHTCSLF